MAAGLFRGPRSQTLGRVIATEFDVIVIGGGPGGSTAAGFLAKAGKRVLLLEKEHFPRFHIGESLLPYNLAIFEELGVMPTIQAAGFAPKYGAQFHLGDKSKELKFVFREGCFTERTEAFQVERSKFDDLLLRHATKLGADVREGVTVERTTKDAGGVTVESRDEAGMATTFRAQFLVDASGRGNLTGNQEGIKVPNAKLRKLAVFGHFENVTLDPGTPAGDTVIVRLDNKWFWLIPLRLADGSQPSKVSVGLVMDRDELAAAKRPAEEVFKYFVEHNPSVAERMKDAKLVSSMHVTSDFSYRNRTFWSPRVVRVGDAAGFIDPIFSSGVFVAMFSGKLAAEAVLELLANGGDGSARFPAYERRIHAAMRIYWEMVENFYTTPFMEVLMEPRPKWDIAAAINAILAGELEGGWRLRWRMRAFFWLVKIQAKYPFMPKLDFPMISGGKFS